MKEDRGRKTDICKIHSNSYSAFVASHARETSL